MAKSKITFVNEYGSPMQLTFEPEGGSLRIQPNERVEINVKGDKESLIVCLNKFENEPNVVFWQNGDCEYDAYYKGKSVWEYMK